MQTYSPVTAEFIEELKQITGPSYVKTDTDLLIAYQTDYESDPKLFHMPEAAVAPRIGRRNFTNSQIGQPLQSSRYGPFGRHQSCRRSYPCLRRPRPFNGTAE